MPSVGASSTAFFLPAHIPHQISLEFDEDRQADKRRARGCGAAGRAKSVGRVFGADAPAGLKVRSAAMRPSWLPASSPPSATAAPTVSTVSTPAAAVGLGWARERTALRHGEGALGRVVQSPLLVDPRVRHAGGERRLAFAVPQPILVERPFVHHTCEHQHSALVWTVPQTTRPSLRDGTRGNGGLELTVRPGVLALQRHEIAHRARERGALDDSVA